MLLIGPWREATHQQNVHIRELYFTGRSLGVEMQRITDEAPSEIHLLTDALYLHPAFTAQKPVLTDLLPNHNFSLIGNPIQVGEAMAARLCFWMCLSHLPSHDAAFFAIAPTHGYDSAALKPRLGLLDEMRAGDGLSSKTPLSKSF